MSRKEICSAVIGLALVTFLILGIGFAFADPQTLEIPIPTATPTPEAFSYHYRLSVGRDGTTVTMHAIEGGPTVKFSCVNCAKLDGGEK
jgi:hypothetical protein